MLAFYDPHAHTYYSIKQLPKLPPEAAKLVAEGVVAGTQLRCADRCEIHTRPKRGKRKKFDNG